MATKTTDVKSAQRTVALLELLILEGRPMSFTDLVGALDIPKSSVHALLHTLVSAGALTRNPENDTYFVSSRWIGLLNQALQSAWAVKTNSVREVAYPLMVQTAQRMSMTCNLGVLSDHNVVYIEKVDAPSQPIRLSTDIGATFPAHATALGKAMLSKLEPPQLAEWLDGHEFASLTPNTIRSAKKLRADLDATRAQGYALDNEEFHLGIICVAACILGRNEEPVAAISVTGMRAAIEALGVDAVGAEMRRAAETISKTWSLGEARDAPQQLEGQTKQARPSSGTMQLRGGRGT